MEVDTNKMVGMPARQITIFTKDNLTSFLIALLSMKTLVLEILIRLMPSFGGKDQIE